MTSSAAQIPLYPLFLAVEGRRCVVVGGGPIATQKARELALSGAHVVVVSPEFGGVDADEVPDGRIEHVARRFQPGDARGALVVFSATADPEVDRVVEDDARAAGALVNIVDVPERCDFYAGSVVRRGPVTISIGTSGASPSLAIAIRRRIEAVLPEGVGRLASAFAQVRPTLKATWPAYADRARKYNALVAAMLDRLDELGDIDVAVERAARCDRPCDGGPGCCAFVRTEEDAA